MRFVIAIFLFSIFCCQALPVAALGKLLAKQKISVCDQDDTDDDDAAEAGNKLKKQETKFEVCLNEAVQRSHNAILIGSLKTQRNSGQLLRSNAVEVEIPPPDFF